ncbi:SNF2 family domain-containing protein [Apiospora arundinis]|uniref:SWI/SNF-related matrix-associated actin-dependent regulator of chromatin subfamily A member 3-like 1 n=1 Tax=Apiospora arundinis TaxID=335852 RepID=A0ABR2IT34_9PEZI
MAPHGHITDIPTHNGLANPSGLANNHGASNMSLNAAQLLNPRQYMTASHQNNVSGRSTPATFPSRSSGPTSLDFQFSSPNEGYASNASTPPSFAYNGAFDISHTPSPVNGFGGMIERMNNVQDRSTVPHPKRRKVETIDLDDSADEKTSSNFGHGGSGGMIGQYVKEKKEEAANSPSLSRANTVDLTEAGDDDSSEAKAIEDAQRQEICYGMIQGAKINCHSVPSPKPEHKSLQHGWWPTVKIVLNRRLGDVTNVINAKDYTRNIVGTLDSQTALGLSPLLDSSRLQLRTDSRIPTRRMDGEKIGDPISKAYNLDLVLYGPRGSAKAVGRHLSQKQLWLRNPTRLDSGIKYENPQSIQGIRPQPIIRDREGALAAPPPQQVRTVEEIRNEVMGVFDSLTRSEDLPQLEPDSRIVTELLKHQKQGLHFMMTKEQPRKLLSIGKTPNSFWQLKTNISGQQNYYNVITGQVHHQPPPETFGGILADMMGLGKTLSILSLVTSTLDAAEEWSKSEPVQPRPPTQKKNHGQSRFNVPTPEPLALTRISRNSRATLLVCPLTTITNWEEQIKTHIKPGTFSYYIYHGSNRIRDPKKLAQYDLVITTYGSVSTEVGSRHKGRAGPHPLEEIGWFRVVLDEAHMIREQSTLQFKAICRLQANRRWAVTGTPVQNKLDDLAALLAFIRLQPFDDKSKFTQYIVAPFKVCDPEVVPKLRVLVDSITLRRLKDKIDLPPRKDQLVKLQFSPSEEKLYKSFERNAQDKVAVLASGRDKMVGGKSYIHILQSILRLRLISAHGRELLSEEDLALVQGMTEDSAIDLDSDDDDKPAIGETRAYEVLELMQETNVDKCFVCDKKLGAREGSDEVESEKEDNILGYLTACFHLICPSCKPTWDAETGNHGSGPCPLCSTHIRLSLAELRKDKADVEHDTHHKTGKKSNCLDNYSGPHSKTRALVEDLLRTKAQSEANPDEAPFKSVVFSAWTSHLDLIQLALDNNGITYTRLDGKMSRTARTAAMDSFRDDNAVHVILVSIMAGGLGLNLTAGNNVYVMEPQYNPAAEAQAVDRVHRLGQKRPVRTVRYIMANSIEEKMLELQEKKMKLASLSMDRGKVMDKAEAAKQKLMDLRSLFK